MRCVNGESLEFESSAARKRRSEAPYDEAFRRREFVRLYAGTAPNLQAYVTSVVPHRSDADDVLQEIGVVLWSKFGEFELGSDFQRWAFRTARLQVLCYYKRSRRHAVRFSPQFVEQVDESAFSAHAATQSIEALRHCLGRLPKEEQALFERRFSDSATTARQIAQETARPESTIYNALARIRRKLMHCLRRKLGDD